jgi:hypothetical protein
MNSTPCTPSDRQAVVKAAQDRLQFLLWLADKLENTTDVLIRREAAAALRQLVSA